MQHPELEEPDSCVNVRQVILSEEMYNSLSHAADLVTKLYDRPVSPEQFAFLSQVYGVFIASYLASGCKFLVQNQVGDISQVHFFADYAQQSMDSSTTLPDDGGSDTHPSESGTTAE